jgi:hypothetical protein
MVRYRFTEVADDQERERISWQSLAAAEAQLSFPGSTLTDERHHDEGEGWGFDNTQLDAMLYRHWAVVAEPSDVLTWFRDELTARGWTTGQSHPFEPGSMAFSSFSRENSSLMLRVFGHRGDQGMVDPLANRVERRMAVLRRHADRQLIRLVTTGRVSPVTFGNVHASGPVSRHPPR